MRVLLWTNSSGVRVPNELWGRTRLYSSRHASIPRLASAKLRNQPWFRHSPRNFPLKLSTKAFCTGLPSWMKWSSTPRW